MLFRIKHSTGLPGCYANAVTMAAREFYNNSPDKSSLGSNVARVLFVIIMYHWSPWVLWNHCHHRNQIIVQYPSFVKEFRVCNWHMCQLKQNIACLAGCYGNAVTMAKKELYKSSAIRKYFKFLFGTYILCDLHITDLRGCYGNIVTRDQRKSIILDFYCLRRTGADFVEA